MTACSDDGRFDELHADRAQELLYQVLISKQPVRRETPSPAHRPSPPCVCGEAPARITKKKTEKFDSFQRKRRRASRVSDSLQIFPAEPSL
jgi:hypothetical protein